MGRMKLTGKEWIVLDTVFRDVFEMDNEKRKKEGKSWFTTKDDDGSYKDIRPEVEELYKYFKEIPERSKSVMLGKIRKEQGEVGYEYWKEKFEDKIPKKMSIKVNEDNYIPFEWTVCYFVSQREFENEEAQEMIENVLDRLQLHRRRSAGGQIAYISKLGGDTSDIETPVPDERDPKYHIGPNESAFKSLEKIKEKDKKERKIPPRLSDQQKFILVKLFEEDGEYRKEPLSKAVALEFDTDGNRFDSWRLSESHSASFSRALSRLEERGLLTVSIHYSPNFVKLTDKGKSTGKEFMKRVDDGRFNLEFENL